MALTDLIPWKKDGSSLPIRRGRDRGTPLDLRDRWNRLMDEIFEHPFTFSPLFEGLGWTSEFVPRIDVSESDKEISISADLPGMEPEDIDILLDNNLLTISGEKKAETEEKGKRFYRLERSYGSFYRTIPLPDEVDENKIEANFRRGVLTIRLPKTMEAQKRSKRITIKSS